MAQERMESNRDEQPQQPSQDLSQGVDIEATLARVSSVTEKVRVVHGVNEGYYSLENKTVGHARKHLRDTHNIPGDAKAVVGGKEVNDDFVLTGGMSLEFTKEAGVKGKNTYGSKPYMPEPPKPKQLKLTKLEKFHLKDFLDLVSDTLDNAGCNEYRMDNTPANRSFCRKTIRASFHKKDVQEQLDHFEEDLEEGKEIVVFDSLIFGYVRSKAEKILGM